MLHRKSVLSSYVLFSNILTFSKIASGVIIVPTPNLALLETHAYYHSITLASTPRNPTLSHIILSHIFFKLSLSFLPYLALSESDGKQREDHDTR